MGESQQRAAPAGRYSRNMLKPGRKRLGRPPGSKNKPKPGPPAGVVRRSPGRPPKYAAGSGLGQITAVVETMVEQAQGHQYRFATGLWRDRHAPSRGNQTPRRTR